MIDNFLINCKTSVIQIRFHMPFRAIILLWVGQKSRSDRDWKERDPPNRGCRGLGWGQSFKERRLRVTKSPFWVTLHHQHEVQFQKAPGSAASILSAASWPILAGRFTKKSMPVISSRSSIDIVWRDAPDLCSK